ncbi:MAG: HEPN domain-containing protein [bacterium]|nr:HEPN domain-containing protein [bacterium]
MPQKLIERLLKEGKLRKQKAGIVQIEALLKQSILDLQEAQKTLPIAERATYVMAYMAMLKAGRALLLSNGYVPDDGAQHRTVVEITSAILGKRYRDITDQFETMRRKRNEMTYEAGILVSKKESHKAFKDGIQLLKQILIEVKKENPQLELNFRL